MASLQGLPRELRDNIYDYVVLTDQVALRYNADGTTAISSDCRLMSTSQQVRAEYIEAVERSHSVFDTHRLTIDLDLVDVVQQGKLWRPPPFPTHAVNLALTLRIDCAPCNKAPVQPPHRRVKKPMDVFHRAVSHIGMELKAVAGVQRVTVHIQYIHLDWPVATPFLASDILENWMNGMIVVGGRLERRAVTQLYHFCTPPMGILVENTDTEEFKLTEVMKQKLR